MSKQNGGLFMQHTHGFSFATCSMNMQFESTNVNTSPRFICHIDWDSALRSKYSSRLTTTVHNTNNRKDIYSPLNSAVKPSQWDCQIQLQCRFTHWNCVVRHSSECCTVCENITTLFAHQLLQRICSNRTQHLVHPLLQQGQDLFLPYTSHTLLHLQAPHS